MKFAIVAALLQAAAFSATNAYPVTANSLSCRSGPGTGYTVRKIYRKGTDLKITCQTAGTSVNGNNIWDRTQGGCYVADYYVKTGTNGYVTRRCSS